MQPKNKPERTCIACREIKNKQDLIRIVKCTDGNFVIDTTGKLNGRGAYICNDIKCLEKAIKSKALNRAFKMEIPADIYLKVKEDLIARNN